MNMEIGTLIMKIMEIFYCTPCNTVKKLIKLFMS